MLSILIPTYNYNIIPLVEAIYNQCKSSQVKFEILAYDDGSESELNSINNKINTLDFCTFKELPKNIGRSAIRNLLAKNAQYKTLLFVDAGTFPKHNNFIENYLNYKNEQVVSGGMTHREPAPKKPYRLRWLYTKKREFKTLCSSNFMINKNVFLSNPFDETLKKYGYEDVLFFQELSRKNIKTLFINNPVIHSADDNSDRFLEKTELAIENLIELVESKKIDAKSQKMYRLYTKLNNMGLVRVTGKFYKVLRPLFVKNFKSSYASMLLFDIYRIGYFCLIKTRK